MTKPLREWKTDALREARLLWLEATQRFGGGGLPQDRAWIAARIRQIDAELKRRRQSSRSTKMFNDDDCGGECQTDATVSPDTELTRYDKLRITALVSTAQSMALRASRRLMQDFVLLVSVPPIEGDEPHEFEHAFEAESNEAAIERAGLLLDDGGIVWPLYTKGQLYRESREGDRDFVWRSGEG